MNEERKIRGLDKMEPDKQTQFEKELTDIEKLIFKPHNEKLETLAEEEIEEYINIDIETLKKLEINNKTIMIFEETRKYIIENKEKILKKIKERKEEERDYER